MGVLQTLLEEDAAPKATDGLTAAAHLVGPCQVKEGAIILPKNTSGEDVYAHHGRRTEKRRRIFHATANRALPG